MAQSEAVLREYDQGQLARLGQALQRPVAQLEVAGVGDLPEYPQVYDPSGQPQPWEWAVEWWPVPLLMERAEPVEGVPYILRLVEIRALIGPCTQVVSLKGTASQPLIGISVCRWWAGAPEGPQWPDTCHATRWRDNFVWGYTKEDGTVGFPMGSGDMPNSSGVWPAYCEAPGDWWGSGGWKPEIEHDTWHLVYQMIKVEDEPGPTPTPSGLVKVAGIYLELEDTDLEHTP